MDVNNAPSLYCEGQQAILNLTIIIFSKCGSSYQSRYPILLSSTWFGKVNVYQRLGNEGFERLWAFGKYKFGKFNMIVDLAKQIEGAPHKSQLKINSVSSIVDEEHKEQTNFSYFGTENPSSNGFQSFSTSSGYIPVGQYPWCPSILRGIYFTTKLWPTGCICHATRYWRSFQWLIKESSVFIKQKKHKLGRLLMEVCWFHPLTLPCQGH